MSESVCAVVVTHRRPDELAKSLDAVSAQTRAPDHLIVVDNDNDDRGCANWSPASRSRRRTRRRAETSAAQAVSRWACCTRWRWAPTGCGWPTTTGGPPTPRCWPRCWRAPTSTGWPRCRRWCAIWTTLSGWRFRCGAAWCGGGGSANCAPRPAAGPVARHRVAVQRRAVPRVDAGGRSACRICGCSCAATRWNCTAGWCAPGCRSAPA